MNKLTQAVVTGLVGGGVVLSGLAMLGQGAAAKVQDRELIDLLKEAAGGKMTDSEAQEIIDNAPKAYARSQANEQKEEQRRFHPRVAAGAPSGGFVFTTDIDGYGYIVREDGSITPCHSWSGSAFSFTKESDKDYGTLSLPMRLASGRMAQAHVAVVELGSANETVLAALRFTPHKIEYSLNGKPLADEAVVNAMADAAVCRIYARDDETPSAWIGLVDSYLGVPSDKNALSRNDLMDAMIEHGRWYKFSRSRVMVPTASPSPK